MTCWRTSIVHYNCIAHLFSLTQQMQTKDFTVGKGLEQVCGPQNKRVAQTKNTTCVNVYDIRLTRFTEKVKKNLKILRNSQK